MFLSTLGLTTDKIIQTALSKSNSLGLSNLSERRGSSSSSKKKPEDVADKVLNHISMSNPNTSHYRRAHAPNRLYISPEYNITMMYKDFCSSYPDKKVSYTYYYGKVKSMNISFVKLGEEECERCDLHR